MFPKYVPPKKVLSEEDISLVYGIYSKAYYPFLVFILFIVAYSAIFSLHYEKGFSQYQLTNENTPAVKYTIAKTIDDSWQFVKQYSIIGAICGALLCLGISYVLQFICYLIPFLRSKVTVPLILFLSYLPLLFVGIHLTFIEARTYVIGNAIISGFGVPLYITALIVLLYNVIIILIAIVDSIRGAYHE